jgi:hypothetical protein
VLSHFCSIFTISNVYLCNKTITVCFISLAFCCYAATLREVSKVCLLQIKRFRFTKIFIKDFKMNIIKWTLNFVSNLVPRFSIFAPTWLELRPWYREPSYFGGFAQLFLGKG